jgi:hypothetical protein
VASYRLRAIGADFEAEDEGSSYRNRQAAQRAAIRAGIAIATDEIDTGKSSSIVEAQLIEGEETIGRFVVALSVEALRTN